MKPIFGSTTKTKETDRPSDILSEAQLEGLRNELILTHADLIVRGLLEDKAREELKEVVKEEHAHIVKNNQNLIDYIVQETVGTGIIEEIIKDETVTDIGYNGTELVIEGNDEKYIYRGSQEITDDYIVRIVQKFAAANEKDFTPKNPIFDGKFQNIRINAVHSSSTTSGTTMSLRIVRPKLALRKDNFTNFAPMYIYNFFENVIKFRTNSVISGETGTGKTELQKLLASFIPFKHKIVLIEDVAETFLKEMFPDKDILSWVTSEGISISKFVKTALRNNPRWILVSETRGEEAYEMIQAVLSGHNIITTLHAVNARAIPTRLVNMAKMGYQVSEESLEKDVRRYFDFGIHIERTEYNGEIIRYLSEIVEFNEDGDKTIFEQTFYDGVFKTQTYELSDTIKQRFLDKNITLDFPSNYKSERALNVTDKVESIVLH